MCQREEVQLKLDLALQRRAHSETVGSAAAEIEGLRAKLERVKALRDTHAAQANGSVFSTGLVHYLDEALCG